MPKQRTRAQQMAILKSNAAKLGLVDGSAQWKSYVFGTLRATQKYLKKPGQTLVQPKGQNGPA